MEFNSYTFQKGATHSIGKDKAPLNKKTIWMDQAYRYTFRYRMQNTNKNF